MRSEYKPVYNAEANTWIAPSERGEDAEQGKERAADYAKAYLKRTANLERSLF